MSVRIVVDSTSDLPKEVASRHGISVVPLNVHFGDQTFKDGVDLSADQFYTRLTTGNVFPTTSQPSPAEFISEYQRLTADGSDVVVLCISSKLSGTHNSAVLAREQLPDPSRVTVVDTPQASLGLGLIAVAAAEAAKAGKGAKEVVAAAQEAGRESRLLGMLDTLDYLAKGGRIGKAQALLGSVLKIKPMLVVRDGVVHPLDKVRTRDKALARMVEIARSVGPAKAFAVLYTNDRSLAQAILPQLEEALGARSLFISQVGPVVGTYMGPGAVGFGVRSEKAKDL